MVRVKHTKVFAWRFYKQLDSHIYRRKTYFDRLSKYGIKYVLRSLTKDAAARAYANLWMKLILSSISRCFCVKLHLKGGGGYCLSVFLSVCAQTIPKSNQCLSEWPSAASQLRELTATFMQQGISSSCTTTELPKLLTLNLKALRPPN